MGDLPTGVPADLPDPSVDQVARRRVVRRSALLFAALIACSATAFSLAGITGHDLPGYGVFLRDAAGPMRVLVKGTGEPATATVSSVVGPAAAIVQGFPGAEFPEQVNRAMAAAGLGPDEPVLERSMFALVSGDSLRSSMGAALRLEDGYAEVGAWDATGEVEWFDPPVRQLPADPVLGATWTSSGRDALGLTYRLDGRIAQASEFPADCIDAITTMTRERVDGGSTRVRTSNVWCPDQGIVRSTDVDTGVSIAMASAWPAETASGLIPTTQVPVSLRTTNFDGPRPMPYGVVGITLPPAVIGGLVVVVDAVSGDVIALQAPGPDEPDDARMSIAWVQHPGGSVLGLATDGERILVTTSERRLMAFDAVGQLLWTAATADASVGSPAVWGDRVSIAQAIGRVQTFDLVTGSLTWQADLGDTIDLPAVTAEPEAAQEASVAVADIAGSTRSFDARGQVRWSATAPASADALAVLPNGDVLVVDGRDSLQRLGSASRWTVSLPEAIVRPPVAFADHIVIAAASAVAVLDAATGDIIWARDDLPDADVCINGDRLFVASSGRLLELDPGGATLAEATFDDGAGTGFVSSAGLMLAPYGDGVVAVSEDGRVMTWRGRDG